MTYSVPYAFVPGTKAKADEVNANFNDVINKLQETNNQVNENYNTLTENYNTLTESCSDLTNNYNTLRTTLNTTNSTLAKKANASDLDGHWVSKLMNLFSAKTWNIGNNDVSYSLNSYLPNDGGIYEVIISGDGNTGASSGASITCYVGSSYVKNTSCVLYRNVTRASATVANGSNCLLPIGTDRKIYIRMGVTGAQSGNTYSNVLAYRKVR